jgi:hypothetical protein
VRGEVLVGRQEAARATAGQAACMQGRTRLQIGSRVYGEERTLIMLFMFLTLEVSKLSSWLNAIAFCRESKGDGIQCGARCRVPEGGRWRATAGQVACRRGRDCRLQGHGTGRSARRTWRPWL